VLAAGGGFGSVRLYRVPTGEIEVIDEVLPTADHKPDVTAAITGIAFSHDDRYVAALDNGRVRVWEVATRTPVPSPPSDREHVSTSWLPDNQLAIAERGRHQIVIWNVDTRATRTIALPSAFSSPLAVNADGTRLALGFDDRTLRVWQTDGASPPIVMLLPGQIRSITWAGDRLVTLDDRLRVWDPPILAFATLGVAIGTHPGVGGSSVAVGAGPFALEVVSLTHAAGTTATIDASGQLTSSGPPSPSSEHPSSGSPSSGSSHR